ncbi:acyltransferase family protein [Aliirhizobium smilacinae]|uniref:Acyltransferase n=1 Tax=Aliirhizobium smilacinae TaxID=1395944 RepID=A0A5C4XI48_9HYPH|nr:acyltransferase [Rhizobium smilacinae]TNM62849.1 acyltransferase [Rhizobium smilacinae]
MNSSANSSRIACLDGLRGLAALWVLVGHAHILTGFRVPIIGDPDLGVDLFVMLSGFLMVFHYQLRRNKEPWEAPSTWTVFWVRRFFRIAPLYYVMLFAALTLGPIIYDARMVIDAFNAVPPQPASRYLDDSATNYLLHLSFLSGFSPTYGYRTALPDWSIGLEMQFYLALPFIMVIVGRLGWVKSILGVVAAGVVTAYVVSKLGYHFPMPTFLPLKMHVFAAGMILAAALGVSNRRAYAYAALACVFVLIPIGGSMRPMHEIVRLLLVIAFFVLVHAPRLPSMISSIAQTISDHLGNRFFHTLGELSFGAYLAHLLILQPVVAYLIRHFEMGDPARWLVTLIITIPMTYALAAAGYNLIEMQGQKIGRSLTRPRTAAA